MRFSVTTRIDAKIRAACDSIGDDQWIDIKYPQAVCDEDTGRWISDAQIAETTYTAFAGTRHAVTARLIVRRIRRDDPAQIPGQDELFPTYRYHAVFTDSPFTLVQAEAQHRGHAIIEQVNADLIAGPLAHLPSGRFSANDAWLTCAAIAHNLTRAAGHLAAGAYTARPARHDPDPDHQRRRPPRAPGPHHPPAPTRALALAGGVRQPVHRRPHHTRLNHPTPTETRRPDHRPQTPFHPGTTAPGASRSRDRRLPHAPESPITETINCVDTNRVGGSRLSLSAQRVDRVV